VSGIVLKHERTVTGIASKPRRVLIVTDTPRLVFLDPVGNIVRGNLELTGGEDAVDVKMVRYFPF
jgi:hypothetical protein